MGGNLRRFFNPYTRMIQLYNNINYAYISGISHLVYTRFFLIVKHNTDKIVYKFDVDVEYIGRFIKFKLDFPTKAPYGEYTYYLTTNNVDVDSLSYDINNTVVYYPDYLINKGYYIENKGKLVTNGYCCRMINIVATGLLFRNYSIVPYKRYNKELKYIEYDKKRKSKV